MKKIILILTFIELSTFAQDIKLTPDLYEYSENSITGVYLCTPTHVENGDCKDVDQEYYENLARITLGIYEIGILEVNNEKTMAFKGPISPGAADALINILKKYPEIKKLTLSSQGGAVEDAYKIADYISKNNYDTWVPVRRMCLSACVPIFLSGKNKIMDGQLGLHTGKFQILDPYQVSSVKKASETLQEAVYQNDKLMMKRVRLFIKLGLSLDIIDKMIEARGDYLVFKSLKELYDFSHEKNYIKTLGQMSEYAKNQQVFNFEFLGYIQLF